MTVWFFSVGQRKYFEFNQRKWKDVENFELQACFAEKGVSLVNIEYFNIEIKKLTRLSKSISKLAEFNFYYTNYGIS